MNSINQQGENPIGWDDDVHITTNWSFLFSSTFALNEKKKKQKKKKLFCIPFLIKNSSLFFFFWVMRTKSERKIYMFKCHTHTDTHNFASSFTKTHIFMQWLIICATSLDMFLFFLLLESSSFHSFHFCSPNPLCKQPGKPSEREWAQSSYYDGYLHIGIDCWLPVMSRSLYVMLSLCVCVAVRSIDFFFFFYKFCPPNPARIAFDINL